MIPMTARGYVTRIIEDVLDHERTCSLLDRLCALAPTRKPVGMSLPMA
jgi:hypothetical protein